MKRVTIPASEAARILSNSGLLGEINRQILHPRGLALSVQVDEDNRAVGFAGLVDYRDDPEGPWFDSETHLGITRKLAAFDAKRAARTTPSGPDALGDKKE